MYQRAEDRDYHFFGVHVLTVKGSQLLQIVCFINPALSIPFNLPPTITL